MRVLLQRVLGASVTIAGQERARIGPGLLVFAGFEPGDTEAELQRMATKIVSLRIFADEKGLMNTALLDLLPPGELLLVSQFTLCADTTKGKRPSYFGAARPEQALPLYQTFIARLGEALGRPVKTGVFGADMQVSLVNDGPVTIPLWSEERAAPAS